MTHSADLPPLYELVTLEETSDITAEAVRLAQQGADEGTVVWADSQTPGRAASGTHWIGTEGGLLCALILRPEMPAATVVQLATVATVSLGAAMADIVSPLTRLDYRWPASILLNEGKAADVWLTVGPATDKGFPWCIVNVGANILQPPTGMGFAAASVQGEGDCRTSPAELLEHFARHFLVWVNRWAEEGFEPVQRTWMQRVSGMGEHIRIALGKQTVAGTVASVDAEGALFVDVAGHGARRITLGEYFLDSGKPGGGSPGPERR